MNHKVISDAIEAEVRRQLRMYDRPITREDAERVTALDLSGMLPGEGDMRRLTRLGNLRELAIYLNVAPPQGFWHSFKRLERLNAQYLCVPVDLRELAPLGRLQELVVSCDDSGDEIAHLEGLRALGNLQDLALVGFGSCDLAPLEQLETVRRLSLVDTGELRNPDAIARMRGLRQLTLDSVMFPDLRFLDALDDDVALQLYRVYSHAPCDGNRLMRFGRPEVERVQLRGGRTCWVYELYDPRGGQ